MNLIITYININHNNTGDIVLRVRGTFRDLQPSRSPPTLSALSTLGNLLASAFPIICWAHP